MRLNSHFLGLLNKIEPTSAAVKKAKKAHEEIRALMQQDEEIAKSNPDSYLAGSYARDTALNHIKDVDVILLIDLDYQTTPPDVVIAWIQGCLQKYYDQVEAQGRSVHVTTETGFDVDIVPSVPLSYRDGPVWIPDRDVQQWVATHPKGQIAAGVEKNQVTEGFYKRLVKIMKHWRDRLPRESARAKSYIVECLVAESLLSTPLSYGQGVLEILRSIYTSYSPFLGAGTVPRIPDPGYPSVNVAKRWKFQEFSDFLGETQCALEFAAAALDAEEEKESARLWKKLFGEKFRPKD